MVPLRVLSRATNDKHCSGFRRCLRPVAGKGDRGGVAPQSPARPRARL
jgi:hypothetical protein